MIWIHGRACRIGDAAKPVCDGTSFARRGVVFVSLSYRLGHLGMFAPAALVAEAGGEPFGNYALMDQIATLSCVWRNIAAFRGGGRTTWPWPYDFRYVSDRHRRPGAGVAHEADIPFGFASLPHTGWDDLTARDRSTARQVNRCWVAFAQTGASPADAGWPRFEPLGEALLAIDKRNEVCERFRQEQLDLAEALSQRMEPGHVPRRDRG